MVIHHFWMKTTEQHPQIAMGVHINQLLFFRYPKQMYQRWCFIFRNDSFKMFGNFISLNWVNYYSSLWISIFYWGTKVTKHLQQRLFRSHLPRELEAKACGHQVWLRTQLTSNVGQDGGWGWVRNQQQKRWVSLVYTCLYMCIYICIYYNIYVYISLKYLQNIV